MVNDVRVLGKCLLELLLGSEDFVFLDSHERGGFKGFEVDFFWGVGDHKHPLMQKTALKPLKNA